MSCGLFGEYVAALGADRRSNNGYDEQDRQDEKRQAERPGEKDGPITFGDHHASTQVLLHHRSEYEPEQ